MILLNFHLKKIDAISDTEDIDENVLEDIELKDVLGRVKIHSSALPVVSVILKLISVIEIPSNDSFYFDNSLLAMA